jgi:hypothetical protein
MPIAQRLSLGLSLLQSFFISLPFIQHLYENGAVKLYSLGKLSSLLPNMRLLISFLMDTALFQALLAKRMPRDFSNSPGQSVCAGTTGNSENIFEKYRTVLTYTV